MIQANELRIGNWVNVSLKSNQGRTLERQIGCQDIVRLFENTGSFDYHPIPLTPEILEKCGFGYASEIGGFADKYHIIYEGKDGLWSFSIFCYLDADCSIIIQHLHQLQNLYYALTGEELQYTP